MTPVIKTSAGTDTDKIVNAIVLGFSSDPVVRWAFPEPHQYLLAFPTAVRLFAGGAFEHNMAYYVDGFSGAALWLGPNVHPDDDALGAHFERTVHKSELQDLFSLFEQMASYHPDEPHWYLPLIGVDPTQQGQGYGSALMKYALGFCDRDKRLAYLESTNPANIPLYKRHGFEVIGEIRAGNSPPMFPMLRHLQ